MYFKPRNNKLYYRKDSGEIRYLGKASETLEKYRVRSESHIPYREMFENPMIGFGIFYKPKEIIFNPPATVVYWNDETKTVVKANGEEFDPVKGFAMAFCKKVLSGSDYTRIFESCSAEDPEKALALAIMRLKGISFGENQGFEKTLEEKYISSNRSWKKYLEENKTK